MLPIKKIWTLFLLVLVLSVTGSLAQDKVTPDKARAIAKEAYIFNYSLVMMYRTMYIQSIDTTSKSYSGGFGICPPCTASMNTLACSTT
jgi:hypothetical protein